MPGRWNCRYKSRVAAAIALGARLLHILHLSLTGCLRAPPVRYGVTGDTGGHVAYVLDAAAAQARLARHCIHSRIFPWSPRLIRLGLPAPGEWDRVARALA